MGFHLWASDLSSVKWRDCLSSMQWGPSKSPSALSPSPFNLWTAVKVHNVRAVSFSFIWGLTEDCAPGDCLSDGSEELLWRGKHIPHLGDGYAVKYTFWWKVPDSQETRILVKDFSACLSMVTCKKLGSYLFGLKICNCLKACSANFLRAQSAWFLISVLKSFQGVLMISDSVLVEPNGKRHSLVGKDLAKTPALPTHSKPWEAPVFEISALGDSCVLLRMKMCISSPSSPTIQHWKISRLKLQSNRSSHLGPAVTNPTSIHEDAISIPGLTRWVKDPALLWVVVWIVDEAQIWRGCGSGVGQQLQLQFNP